MLAVTLVIDYWLTLGYFLGFIGMFSLSHLSIYVIIIYPWLAYLNLNLLDHMHYNVALNNWDSGSIKFMPMTSHLGNVCDLNHQIRMSNSWKLWISFGTDCCTAALSVDWFAVSQLLPRNMKRTILLYEPLS